MKCPPIEWQDLIALGVDPAASVSVYGDAVSITPRPSRLVVRLMQLLSGTQLPDHKDDRVGYMRAIRDALMSVTDWSQMPDSPLTDQQRAAWADYRQALRDLPDNYVAPGPIPWPKEPV